MDDILSVALSTDNTLRRRGEATLNYLRTQRGFSVALAKRLASTTAAAGPAAGGDADDPGGQIGSLAGVLLQHFVADLWQVADHAVLPREDKAQVSIIAAFKSFVLYNFGEADAPTSRATRAPLIARRGGRKNSRTSQVGLTSDLT